MLIRRTVFSLRDCMASWREEGQRIGLVTTMGALHEGHLSLVRQAKQWANRVVVSIFVNPTQFGANEDFALYPRDEEADVVLLREAGADVLYAPESAEMYPEGFRTTVNVREISRRWEGEARPGHFDGVATIVTKLLTQTAPDIALFGEKDFQQLQVIKRLALDLDLPVAIVGCPTIRDDQGLALSSRNAYLTAEQMTVARTLNRILHALAVEAASAPGKLPEITKVAIDALLENGFDKIDYLAICDAETLEPLVTLDRPARILAAVMLGKTRLLDNVEI